MWKEFSNKNDPNNLSPATLPSPQSHHLLLSSGFSISLLSSPLRPLSGLSVIASGSPELSVLRWSVLFLRGDLALSDSRGIWSNWEGGGNKVLGSGLEVLSAGVTLLWLSNLAGEKNEFRSVGLEALNVGSESWYRVVDTAVVDGDTDCTGEGGGDLCSLQLLQGETPASSNTTVVLDGGASDNWSQLVNWAGSQSSCLSNPGISPTELAAWLVEVSADASLPLLSEVVVGDLLERKIDVSDFPKA